MHRRNFLSGVAASLPFLSGCSGLLDSDNKRLKTYSSEKYRYSILYPSEWSVDTSRAEIVVNIRSPSNSSGVITITVMKMPSGTTLDEFIKNATRAMKEEYDTVKIHKQRSFTLPSGQSAKIIDVTMKSPRLGPSHGKYCFAIADGTVYHTRVVFSGKYYKENKKKATTIVESFTIESTPGSIDVSQLDTYTNEKYGYSVQYPSGLTINDTDPSGVVFEDQQSEFVVGMATSAWDARGQTVDTLISEDVQRMKNKEGNGPVVLLDQRSFTLPREQSATIIYAKVENISVYHVKACYAIVDGTAYRVRVLIHEDGYIASRQAATTIVESLTIE